MGNQENQSIHLYSEGEAYKLYQGSMLDMLDVIEPNSIDAIVTDPPYELGFMGKSWDSTGIAFQIETWRKCFDVLKPGSYLLAFGGSRTFHRIACAIEDAGFEIRDTIMWLYGSGFPKSMNMGLAVDKKNGVESELGGVKPGHEGFVGRTTNGDTNFQGGMAGFDRPWMHDNEKREAYHYKKLPTSEDAKQWDGWGTALKPAYEPVIVARKPFDGSCVDNILKYGVGGLNIDECRVPSKPGEYDIRHYTNEDCFQNLKPKQSHYQVKPQPEGRFPSNVILTYDDTDKEEVCGGMPDVGSGNNGTPYNYVGNDDGSASRYFYCAKASKRDRDEGLDAFPDKFYGQSGGAQAAIARGEAYCKGSEFNTAKVRKNTHPTVKPVSLMQYLIRLVTPKGGIVLDPFNGSGSTGKAAMYENHDRNAEYTYIGVELTPEYLPISDARIRYALQDKTIIQDSVISKDEKKCISKPKRLFDLPDT